MILTVVKKVVREIRQRERERFVERERDLLRESCFKVKLWGDFDTSYV